MESIRLFVALPHDGSPCSPISSGRRRSPWPPIVLTVMFFVRMLGPVLLAVMLRTVVIGSVLGLLRADRLHRIGGLADLTRFDHCPERRRRAFSARRDFRAFFEQIGKTFGLVRRQPDNASVLNHGTACFTLPAVNGLFHDALCAHRAVLTPLPVI